MMSSHSPEGARARALLAGATTLDRCADGHVAGGSVLYGARAYLALGARVDVVTSFDARTELGPTYRGCEVAVQPAAATVTFDNRYALDGTVEQRVDAPITEVRVDAAARAALSEADIVHLAPVLGELDLIEWLAATADHSFVTLGAQGWLRRIEGGGPTGPVVPARFRPSALELCFVDAVFLSDEDVREDPGLVAALARQVPLVVQTRGAEGAVAYSRGRVLDVPATPVEPVDPSGAGDTFAAVCSLRLAQGCSLERALGDASRGAAETVLHEGLAPAPRLAQAAQGEAPGRMVS